MSAQLPPFSRILQAFRALDPDDANQQLSEALSLLFEPSSTLTEKVIPQLIGRIRNASDTTELPTSYGHLIDITTEFVSSLPDDQKASFIGGHPRIGEAKELSTLSAAEQGQVGQAAGVTPTSPEILQRLAFLNTVYEKRYPSLVYITFVNGRTRAQIRDELEGKLWKEGVLPAADEPDGTERVNPHVMRGDVWRKELERAVGAVRDIAYSRLQKLGVA